MYRWLGAGGAVNLENGASDIASEVGGEEEEGIRDIHGLADAAERNSIDERLDHLGRESGDHVGIGDAWSNGVDPDAGRGQFPGEGFSETVNCKLGGGIGDAGRLTVDADHGGGVENDAGFLLLHGRDNGFREIENGAEVEVDDFVDFFRRGVLDRFIGGHASIVDEDVDAAVFFEDFGDSLPDFGIIIQVRAVSVNS